MDAAYQGQLDDHFQSRYKSIESEDDTRNPTTHKKKYGTPIQFKRSNVHPHQFLGRVPRISNPISQIQQQIHEYEIQKNRYMRQGKFKLAQKMQQGIRRTQSMLEKQRLKRLISKHKSQKRSVTIAHKSEMHFFNNAWANYFQKLDQRQQNIKRSFQIDQIKQIENANRKFIKRCQSARSRSRQIIELEQKQDYLMKVGNFRELAYVRKMLKNAANRQKQERHQMLSHWKKLQQEKLSLQQSKKYSNLLKRLDQFRKTKQKVYMREQKRLRQKYKNVLLMMNHDHAIELHYETKLSFFHHSNQI